MGKLQKILITIAILYSHFSYALADFPIYADNPFSFTVDEPVGGWGEHFFAVDLTGDHLPDYTYLSTTTLYVYNHFGAKLWQAPISAQGSNFGTKHGAADVDGDGIIEIIAIADGDQINIFNATNGVLENTIELPLSENQIIGHVAVANVRGQGDCDILVQTSDISSTGSGYYINRSLIALRMDTMTEIWRVEQDNNLNNGIYEGYWGVAHGSFQCADIDGDGKDEVVGGVLIDDNGAVIPLGYPSDWIGYTGDGFIDHFDAICLGDFRPDIPGLEWILTEEDWCGQTDWHTSMLSQSGILWRNETSLFWNESDKEPQNAAAGNFDTGRQFNEVWIRSRFGGVESQHPWIFDAQGNQFSDYETAQTLPAGFNTHPDYGNHEGLEVIWTIDWKGTPKEYIAAKARHNNGNVGVFDAVTGQAVWSTVGTSPEVQASSLYVADVAGDYREEIIIYDEADGRIKIYWNEEANLNPSKPDKWKDPLYRRLKQNWNYYSPGSYTYGQNPVISDIQVIDVTPSSATIRWETDIPSDTQVEYGETENYGFASVLESTLKTNHTVILSTLNENTKYHFRTSLKNEDLKSEQKIYHYCYLHPHYHETLELML